MDGKTPTISIDVVLERQTTKQVLCALLHAILFHRLLGTVKPRNIDVLDVTLPAVQDAATEKLVEDKVDTFWRAVENGRNKFGQIVLTFAEKRERKQSTWPVPQWPVKQFFGPTQEEVPWEQWLINAEIRQPASERERQTLTANLNAALVDALRKVITHTSSERGRAIVPLITGTFAGLSPFPIELRVKVGGAEYT